MVRWLTLARTILLGRIGPASALLLALLFVPAAAHAQTGGLGNCQRSRSWQQQQLGPGHYKLIGQVEIDCGEQSFAADEVEFFSDRNLLIAIGNVVFTSGNNRIAADRLEYDTAKGTGTFYNATGTATLRKEGPLAQDLSMFGTSEPDVYFYGRRLEKVGREKYKITKGGFTTCVQPTPRWSLTSGTVLLNLESYAILTNSFFRVKGVPVLYMPVFYYPINEEDRATGFLIPTYGSSTLRGQTISNAFFWAINRSQDATLFHDRYSRSGQGLGAEYRYAAGPGSGGEIRFYNLREGATTFTDTDGSIVEAPERRSYDVRGSMSQRLGRSFRLRGRADYFSDITVQQAYNQNVYDASRRQRVYSAAISGNVGTWSLNGAYDRSELFYGTTQSTVRGGTPRVSVQRAEQPLFGSPVYFSVSGEAVNLIAERRTDTRIVDNGLARFDVLPRVRFPFTRWPFLSITTSAAFRSTYWTERRGEGSENLDDPISRNYYEVAAQITGPVFNRIWDRPGSRYAEKLKHAIEPFLNVQRISPIDNFDEIVRIDSVDTIVGRTTRVNYGVNNRLFRKPGGGGQSREIMTVSLGQSYYSDARAAQFDSQYRSSYGSAPSKFSPLSLHVRAWPTPTMNAQFRAEYDTQFKAFRTMSADGTLALGDWLHTSLGWSQRRFIEGLPGFDDPSRLTHYLNGATTWRSPRNRIGGTYTFNYDVRNGSFLQQRIMGYYNAQCCGFALEYQTFDLSGLSSRYAIDQDRRFNFSITLAGIGSFSNFFGAFGGGGGGAGRY